MNRRLFVATVAAGSVGASAGCLSGFIDDVTSFKASPAVVSAGDADDAGYEYQGTKETVRSEEVAGESVEATNYISEYTRTIDMPLDLFDSEGAEAGVFAVITTPQVRVADQDFNPVGDMTNEEIVELVQNQYDELTVGDNIGGRALEGLGGRISIESYEGEAAFQGTQGVDVFLDIAQPDRDGDHLVIIAVYPDDQELPLESERDRVDTMVEGLEHGDDVDVEIVEDEGEGDESDGNESEGDD